MADAYESGVMYSGAMPAWQRTYYSGVLMDTIRMKSIMVPFCAVKEDFRAKDTGVMVYSEVFDTAPNWNPADRELPVAVRYPPGHPLDHADPGNPWRYPEVFRLHRRPELPEQR